MHLLGKSALVLLLFITILFPQGNWEVSVQKNLVEEEQKNLTFEDGEAIIAISRNQCTRCNRSMVDLVNYFHAYDKRVTVIRLLDADLMDCKGDEVFFRDEYPDLPFEYTSDKILTLVQSDQDSMQVSIKETPVLITMGEKLKIYHSNDLVDKYGRLKDNKFN